MQDHTAIIVSGSSFTVNDPSSVSPSALGHLTVIEQSRVQLPVQETYDLATLTEGEVWIYRVVGEERILGEGVGEMGVPPRGWSLDAA